MDHTKWPVQRTDNYVRFSIPERRQFSNIEYKVLQNQNESRLLRCSQVTLNGCLQLLYNVQQMQPVSGVLTGLSTRQFYRMLEEVILLYSRVKKNGFLDQEHLVFDQDCIYLSMEPFQVSMLYLPVESVELAKSEVVDGTMIGFLQSLTYAYGHETDAGISKLAQQLDSAGMKLEMIVKNLQEGCYEDLSEAQRRREQEELEHRNRKQEYFKNIRLVLKNSSPEWSIPITKEEFVIGKKASVVDGVIPNHPTVSRIHCKIVNKENQFYVVDLGSANGTLVNGTSCPANIPVPIRHGDQIMISNLIFYFMEEK